MVCDQSELGWRELGPESRQWAIKMGLYALRDLVAMRDMLGYVQLGRRERDGLNVVISELERWLTSLQSRASD